jgi:hypothetical protein
VCEGITHRYFYTSPAKAGAYRSAARAHPRRQGIVIALEVPSGGGMGPGFRRESKEEICRLHIQARFQMRSGEGVNAMGNYLRMTTIWNI